MEYVKGEIARGGVGVRFDPTTFSTRRTLSSSPPFLRFFCQYKMPTPFHLLSQLEVPFSREN